MSIGTISVSIAGDEAYRKALKALAAQRGITVGELVRASTDAKYGDQLETFIRFFSANSEDKNPQSQSNILTKETVNVNR